MRWETVALLGFRIFMWDDGDVYSEQKTENTGIQ